MGDLATVRIRNKRNGKIRIINQSEWAHDLGKGKYDGWTLDGGERRADSQEDVVEAAVAAEMARQREVEAAKQREAELEAEAQAESEAEDDVEAVEESTTEEVDEAPRRGRSRR